MGNSPGGPSMPGAPGALPFKPAGAGGAGERETLGLPPAQDRRDPGVLGAGPAGGREKRGSALGRHRKWLSAAGAEMRAARRGKERKDRAAAGRKVRLGQFSQALRRAILHGEGDLEELWPALSASSPATPGSAGGEGDGSENGEVSERLGPKPSASETAYEDLPSELPEEEAYALQREMAELIDAALVDKPAAAETAQGAGEGVKEGGDQDGEGTKGEEDVLAPRPSSSSSSKPAPRLSSSSSARPAWALTEDQAELREDQEETNLLDFALNLDFEEFMDDLDDKEREEASRIIEDMQESQRRMETAQAEAATAGESDSAWKSQFVTAVNAAAGRELLEKLKFGKLRTRDPDAQSVLSSVSTASRATEASHLKARLGTQKREDIEAAAEARKHEGTFVSAGAQDTEAAKAKFRQANEALGQAPRLRDVHSPASVREMIQQEHVKLQQLSPIQEEAVC